jgi:hypothetical protein
VITGIHWEDRLTLATRTDRTIQPLHELTTSITDSRITIRAPIRVITAALLITVTEIGIPVPESVSILVQGIHASAATAPITVAGSEEASDTAVLSGTTTIVIMITGTTAITGTTDVIIKYNQCVFQTSDTQSPAVSTAGLFDSQPLEELRFIRLMRSLVSK